MLIKHKLFIEELCKKMTSICLYFEVHQPMRLNHFSVFHIGGNSYHLEYFNKKLNEDIFTKVAKKCYLPTNNLILELIRKYDGRFRVSYSLTGTFIEYCKEFVRTMFILCRKSHSFEFFIS